MNKTTRTPPGILAGAIVIMLLGAVFVAILGLGVYKAATQPPADIAWCEYGQGQCKEVCRQKEFTILYFRAGWCPACKRMDEQTFADVRVKEKLASYGTIRIDIDANPNLAKSASVEGIPTIVVLHGCKEVMRMVGNEGPDAFLGFLDGVEKISKEK